MFAGNDPNLRNSIRFPLQLQVRLKTAGGEYHARTTNVSAGGVSFHLDSEIAVGERVEFAIEMPSELSGINRSVNVMCVGRVVRCTREALGRNVAVVIDEYRFQRN
jgi:hypothetical protein